MFGLFKKNGKQPQLPQLFDLDDQPIAVGDLVLSLRYDLGKSELVLDEGQYFYKSLETGKKVSWIKMVDAITEKQKVKKITEKP